MFSPELLISGQLVRVLDEWCWPGGPELALLYRRSTKMPKRIAAFIEFTIEVVNAFDPLELTIEHRV